MALRYVKIFYGWPEETSELTLEEKGSLIDAIVAYARGDPVTFIGNERVVFPVFRAQVDRDSDRYDVVVQRNRENGRKGGRPKNCGTQSNPGKPTGFSETPRSEGEGKGKGVSPLSPEGNDAQDDLLERFDRFWSVYPRKVAKQNAIRAWKKLCPDEALTRQILDAVERFKLDPQWTRNNGQFIPYPATFLNGHRWEDAPSEEPPPAEPRARQDVADLDSLYA